MNLYNVKNIKDLPQLEQILPGNFLVVENFTGTNKLDFDDFVIGPRNTSFANQVFNDILSLSSYSVALTASDMRQMSMINSLSTTVTYISSYVTSSINSINLAITNITTSMLDVSARLKELVPGF